MIREIPFIEELTIGMNNQKINLYIVKPLFIISALVVGFIIANEIIAILTGNNLIG